MKTHHNESPEQKNKSNANGFTQPSKIVSSAVQLKNKKPSVIAQQALQEKINASSKVKKVAQLQESIDKRAHQLKSIPHHANQENKSTVSAIKTAQLQKHTESTKDRPYNETLKSVRSIHSPIQLRIDPKRAGTYQGYTRGTPNQLPTLYFKKGRLTQEHNEAENVGWHDDDPREKIAKYHVNQEGFDKVGLLSTTKRHVSYETQYNLAMDITNGKYAHTDEDPAIHLVEIAWKKNTVVAFHPSRGILKEPDDEFDQTYAAGRLETAEPAANNERWVLKGFWPFRKYVQI